MHDFQGFPSVAGVQKDTVNRYYEPRFSEVQDDDVGKLLENHAKSLTDEELLLLEHDHAYEEEKLEEEPSQDVRYEVTQKYP